MLTHPVYYAIHHVLDVCHGPVYDVTSCIRHVSSCMKICVDVLFSHWFLPSCDRLSVTVLQTMGAGDR